MREHARLAGLDLAGSTGPAEHLPTPYPHAHNLNIFQTRLPGMAGAHPCS